MEEQLQSLLSQISEILVKEKTLQRQMMERGESYNIFKVLHLQRDEVRLHSAFIANLLDPKGSHGMKTKFLESFLSIMSADDILKDLNAVKSITEMYISPISNDGTRGGRMDIVLMDKSGNAVIIENKIDARDQPKQLLRYHNYCKEHFKAYRIYYLTKWGTDASDESIGGKKFDYRTASYREHILQWLDSCIEIASPASPLQEILRQYKNNLVNILNIMSEKSTTKLLKVATLDKNIEATLAIMDNQFLIGERIRFDFLKKLLALAENYGFKGDVEKAEALANLRNNTYLKLVSEERSQHYCIYIGNDTQAQGHNFSIASIGSNKIKKTDIASLNQLWGCYDKTRKRVDYPYGWEYFWSESGERNSGRWWRWDDIDTLRAMNNGSFLKFIKNEIIKKTVDNRLLERLEELL